MHIRRECCDDLCTPGDCVATRAHAHRPYLSPPASPCYACRVPRDNGLEITGYILRRMDPTATATEYDYSFECASNAAKACGSYISSCWPSGFSCTGTYSLDYVPTWDGGDVEVVIGSDVDLGDGSYLAPDAAYSWKVIALNANNANCTAEHTCDASLEDDGTGFSGREGLIVPLIVTQEKATPDQPTSLQVGSVSQTEATLKWRPPVDNGSPVDAYRIICTDAEADYATAGWSQPQVRVRVRVSVRVRVRVGVGVRVLVLVWGLRSGF